MATAPDITGAPTCAPSNVIRLPTASTRKVQQNYNRAARSAKAELPQFPGEFICPGIRKAMSTAEALIQVRQCLTPEMELLTAICQAVDESMRTRIELALLPGDNGGRPTASQARAVVRMTRMTVGEQVDLHAAIDRLQGSR